MANNEMRPSSAWKTASELPPELFAALCRFDKAANPTVVVATIDADGSPRTAPFGSLRTITPRLLRFACDRQHSTFANLSRDGRVTVCMLLPPDIAVSIRGRARVHKAQMEVANTDAVVEIEVQEVKNDAISGVDYVIESGVTIVYPESVMEMVEKYITEVEKA